jgi:hypothetical protein
LGLGLGRGSLSKINVEGRYGGSSAGSVWIMSSQVRVQVWDLIQDLVRVQVRVQVRDLIRDLVRDLVWFPGSVRDLVWFLGSVWRVGDHLPAPEILTADFLHRSFQRVEV